MIAALVGACATLLAGTVAIVAKVVADARERRRHRLAVLTAIRNELRLNSRLASLIRTDARMAGLRFADSIWRDGDTSVIYDAGVPTELLLDIYADLQAYNAFSDRRQILEKHQEEAVRDRIARERVEALEMVERVATVTPAVVEALGRLR